MSKLDDIVLASTDVDLLANTGVSRYVFDRVFSQYCGPVTPISSRYVRFLQQISDNRPGQRTTVPALVVYEKLSTLACDPRPFWLRFLRHVHETNHKVILFLVLLSNYKVI